MGDVRCDPWIFVFASRSRQTLLNPLACLYHSLILFKVDLRVRSNMNRIATASLDTRGNIETNSR